MNKIKIVFALVIPFYTFQVSVAALGFSGMEKITSDTYLIVQDKKVYEDGNRVGILKIIKGAEPSYSPLTINDWKHPNGQASDLESVCKIPGEKNEFLLAEAGYWEGKYGRIFHIKLEGVSASVLNVYSVPQIIGSAEGVDGDNFEGMVCFKKNKTIYVLLGERGGSKIYKNGYLRIGIFDHSKSILSWEKFRNSSIEIEAPGSWTSVKSKRSISDLTLDENDIIWAVATEDAGDEGPFKSVIYKAAILTGINKNPVKAIATKKEYWIIDGFKVEALSGPTDLIPGSYMSFGTEDESYDGVWRPLFDPSE